jgi:hypothetical protein
LFIAAELIGPIRSLLGLPAGATGGVGMTTGAPVYTGTPCGDGPPPAGMPGVLQQVVHGSQQPPCILYRQKNGRWQQ